MPNPKNKLLKSQTVVFETVAAQRQQTLRRAESRGRKCTVRTSIFPVLRLLHFAATLGSVEGANLAVLNRTYSNIIRRGKNAPCEQAFSRLVPPSCSMRFQSTQVRICMLIYEQFMTGLPNLQADLLLQEKTSNTCQPYFLQAKFWIKNK